MDLGRSRSNSKIAWEKIMNKNRIPPIKFKIFLNHWSYTELKAVKDVRDGTHSSPKYIENGYPLVTSKNLTDSGLSLNDVSLISESDYNEINKRSKVETGDILLGLIGTIGKPVLVDSEGFAIKNVGLIKNGGQIQNQFLLQYLKTNIFNKYIQIEMAGNTQKFLGLETLRNTKVPVPSPDEQSAIGFLFRTLDDLLASYKDNLANYQSLKAVMLSKMFPKAGQTVPEIRLDGFKGEWEVKKLENVLEFYAGLTYKPNDMVSDGTLVLRSSNVRDGEFIYKDNVFVNPDIVNCQNVKLGDIVVVVRNGSRDLIGKHALIKSEMPNTVIGAFMTGVRCEVPEFVNALLDTNMFISEINKNLGATINQITTGNFKRMKFYFPDKEEQQVIGSYFANLDDLIAAHQEKISQLETLKKKFLQDMFI